MTFKHGASAYRSGTIKCRCEVCRAGHAARSRLERAARRGKEPPTHDRYGYSNWGCRCEVCSDDHAAMLHDQYLRRKERQA